MEELLKNDIIELTVEGQGINGEGVARAGGKTIFIRGALKGEKVRAKIILVKPRFDIAITTEILGSSPERVSPPCPIFGKCGGCDLQHMRYAEQLNYKRALVEETLLKVGGISAALPPVVSGGKEYHYRNKISLPVRQTAAGLKLGLFAKNSHRTIETDDCLLQYEWNAPLISALKKFMEENGLSGYDEESGKGDVRHLVAREIGGRLYVTLVVASKLDCKSFIKAVKNISPDCEVWLNVNRRRDNVILGNEWLPAEVSGRPVEIDGLKTCPHPGGFFQVNDCVREKLYDYVSGLCEGGAAVEAYSGAGLLSARLAGRAAIAYGIELDERSHAAAEKLKELNRLKNFYPICGDVGDKLADTIKKCKTVSDNTFVVLDPPRAGISDKAADALINSGADNIVYISCNPATLARDVKKLSDAGYRPAGFKAFDMFPQTVNVETVALLSRQDEKKNRLDN